MRRRTFLKNSAIGLEALVDTPLDTIPVYLRAGAVVPAQLSHELQFGSSMTAGSVHALVVTPRARSEHVTLLNARNEMARVTVRLLVDGFAWELDNLPEISYLLVYGLVSASVVWQDLAQANFGRGSLDAA